MITLKLAPYIAAFGTIVIILNMFKTIIFGDNDANNKANNDANSDANDVFLGSVAGVLYSILYSFNLFYYICFILVMISSVLTKT
ncbi:hypothetical protein AA973_00995 [Helicobacter pylori]|uniref:Uncharacterized protein n=2 Tax=Helicobacter pylori TaxID=210 RepID=A0A1A9H7M0_HELPX|nr:hypothetical protein AA973_00995 [Helicobacter pylori]